MDPMTRRPHTGSDETKTFTERVGDKVHQTADDTRNKSAGEMVDEARASTDEALNTAKQKASEVGTAVSDKATDAMTSAGGQMSNLAHTVRDKAPTEGRAGEIASDAADALERGGQYLQQADPTMIRGDLERIIRERPIESMLVGLGVGYLLARAMRR